MSKQQVEKAMALFHKEGNKKTIYDSRKFIAHVLQYFLSVEKVRKPENASGDYLHVLINYQQHCLDDPKIFLSYQYPVPRHEEGKYEEEEKTSYAFCFWFLSKFLHLLGYTECKNFHVKCMDIVLKFLNMAKYKDPRLYSRVVTEIIYSVADLVQINEQMFNSNDPSSMVLRRFVTKIELVQSSLSAPDDVNKKNDDSAVKITSLNLEIPNLEVCENLQIYFTKILNVVVNDIATALVPYNMNAVLWTCMCWHVENGDVDLKVESLAVLEALLEKKDLPTPGPGLEYLLACISALIDLMCSGCKDVTDQEAVKLENGTSNLILKFIAANKKVLALTHLSADQAHVILQKLTATLTNHTLSKLRTCNLKSAITDLILHMFEILPVSVLVGDVCKPLKDRVSCSLIGHIGHGHDMQYIVAPLVKSVMCEITDDDKILAEQSSYKCEKPDQSSRKRKSKSPKPGVKKKSDTYKLLVGKLTSLTSELAPTTKNVIETLEGIRVIIEIFLYCLQTCRSIQQKQTDESIPDKLCDFDAWFKGDMLRNVIGRWIAVLPSFLESSIDNVNEYMKIIIKCSTSLLSIHETDDLEPEMLTTLCWIISIPWLPNDPSWMDLRPSNSKHIAELSSNLCEKIDSHVKFLCLKALSCFPKEVASKWRVHVFKQACSDDDTEVKKGAIMSFPLLLLHLGPNANHLVYQLIHPLVEDTRQEIQEVIADLAGILACVVCRKTSVRKNICDPSKGLLDCKEIMCMSCDLTSDKDTDERSKERPRLVDPNMFSPFLTLLQAKDTDIKLKLIESLKRMFGHIGVRSNNPASVNMLKSCLSLIDDQNYDIRRKFGYVISYLIGDGNKDVYEMVRLKLEESTARACQVNNISLQETIIIAIGQLGRVADDDLLLWIIISLLQSMLSPVKMVGAMVYEQLKSIAKHKETKVQNLFIKSRFKICKILVESMHEAHVKHGGMAAKLILKNVAEVLTYPSAEEFLKVTVTYMVPHLITKATQDSSALIKMIATILDEPSRERLLLRNFVQIFSYLIRYCQAADKMAKAIKFFEAEAKGEIKDFLKGNFLQVHEELCLYLSTHYSEIKRGLKYVSSFDDERIKRGAKDITTEEEMADYLQPRLLPIIKSFDSKLLNVVIAVEDKKLILASLIPLMKLMGPKHIGTIRFRIFNTLRIGLKFKDPEFINISCRAWNSFVRSLESQYIGPMMSQVIATLLPLLDKLPRQVADIFNYMIVDNRGATHQHFHEVYYLPDIPELAAANQILRQYTDGPSSQSDLKTQLLHSIKGITHETLDVRIHALSKLKKLMREEKDNLIQLIIGNETADPVITQLASILLSGCRESDKKAQCLFAECIGQLGAIDPGRLDFMVNSPLQERAKFHISIDDDNFAVGLINEVVKAYLACTETRNQDRVAFALQELLRIYAISEPKEGEPTSGKLWKRFEEHVQEVLEPFLSTWYILEPKSDWSKLVKPIYGSEKGHDFKSWVSTWTAYLTSKVVKEKAKKIFQATVPNNIDIALYILPHIVLHVIQEGSQDDLDDIVREIKEVLNQAKKPDIKHRSDFHHLSAQTVFKVLDYLTKWKRYKAQFESGKTPHSGPSYLTNPSYIAVCDFLLMIPQDLLSDACFTCSAYTRALMHFEQFLSNKDKNVQDHLDFMQRLYIAMDEPDGVVGVAAIRNLHPTIMEQILTHESLGQHQDAQACYEKMIQAEPDDVGHHQGLLRSLMELGQHNKALLHATGAIAEKYEWGPQLNSYMVEAAWKLGDWKKLEKCITGKFERETRNWSVSIGKILLAAKDKKEKQFWEQLQIVRHEQIGPLSAASMESGSYQRGYEYIIRLNVLNEIEEFARVLLNIRQDDGSNTQQREKPEKLFTHWESCIQIMQYSFRTQEPILSLRRTLFTLAQEASNINLDHEIGHCWLWSAKIARKAGYIHTAYSSLLQAEDYHLPEVFLEKAKWFWFKGDHDQALSCLERGISVHFPDASQLLQDTSEEGKKRRQIYAKAQLLYGHYNEETSSLESNSIVKCYKEVTDLYQDWEDGYFYLAKYYDKIMMTLVLEDKDKPDPMKQLEFVTQIIKYFGISLKYGNQYIYQSMPRMLSLWLDCSTGLSEIEAREKQKIKGIQNLRTNLAKLNSYISSFGSTLAPYQLFTAFPQLISRICHGNPDVFQQLKEIIARLYVQFPQQAMWMMMAVSKSSYQTRVQRCREIFATAKSKDEKLHKFIQDGTKLTERLIDLCNKEIKGQTILSATQLFRPLKRMLEDGNFSQIALPLQSVMNVTLPNTQGPHPDHNAFPANPVYIQGLEDTIEILPSLQKPKKITFNGSDGRLYVMMCKPKDDLRKDCRLMEFNTIVNKLLHKDPDSRRRQLHIRTYTVIPLNEECGIIEWVNNTHGLRNILMKLYRERGPVMTGMQLKNIAPPLEASIDEKLRIYKEKLLPRHPSVFKEWFLRTFPDPTSWYNARLSYARTLAVMSMVGYILGLGDRHGENILFDSTCGDCVHVDFNCLFNKGETFEWPERVPFRLTHNMIDALGPLGYEGIFRRACEVTLRVMRTQMDPLMSILKPFVYDPLVEWSKPVKGQRKPETGDSSKAQKSNTTETGEINNEKAMTHVQNIEDRLKGILKSKGSRPRSVPLSIEGHVNYLIQQSTDERNLCQMYIGWAPYM